MLAIRFTLLLVILAGLAGFTVQNLSPAIPLVFLGLRSQPIPLSLLIWGALTAGLITGLALLLLLRLSSAFGNRVRSRRPGSKTTAYSQTPPVSEPRYTSAAETDTDYSSYQTDYEVEQHPTSSYQSGSTYSYSYRDTGQTSVGQRESVVDAEYREVTPPRYPVEDEDDFGFEDDDFEDESSYR